MILLCSCYEVLSDDVDSEVVDDVKRYKVFLRMISEKISSGDFDSNVGGSTAYDQCCLQGELFSKCALKLEKELLDLDNPFLLKDGKVVVPSGLLIQFTQKIKINLSDVLSDFPESYTETIRQHLLTILRVSFPTNLKYKSALESTYKEKPAEAKASTGSANFIADLVSNVQKQVEQNKDNNDLGALIGSVMSNVLPMALNNANQKMKSGELSKESLMAAIPNLASNINQK